MIKRLSTFCLLSLGLALQVVGADPSPNVVVIFADDLGYGDLSCYGATKLKTPNIDRLASEGRRFTDAHSASAVCTPSRYALITGRYPFRIGISSPVFLKTGLIIDTDRTTVADVMKGAGYTTACIGKWHLGFGKKTPDWNGDLKPGPLELGFDYYYGVPVVNSHPPFVYVENHRVVGLVPDDPFVYGKRAKTREFPEKMAINQIGGADAAHALYDDEAVGTRLAEKSVEWISANKEKPFFLYLSTTNIHHPFTPAKRFQGTSECGRYGDFVHELDWIVGEVMNTLEKENLAENTLVIFTSDNGGMFNVGGQDAWTAGHQLNGELLGFKFGAWEGGHRVPFIARWPGTIPAASTSDQLISNIDLLATMAALVERPLKEDEGPDSFNVLPALTASPTKPIRDHLVLAASKKTHVAMRSGNWVYIGAQGSGGFTAAKRGAHAFGGPAAITFAGRKNSDIVDGKYKSGAPKAQLYDLAADLPQSRNVIRENPERAEELRTLLTEIRAGKGTRPGLALVPAAETAPEKPHVVLVVGTLHYSPELTMPVFAKELERFGFRTTVVMGEGDPEKKTENVLPGIEVLKDADLAIFFMRFLKLPDEEWQPIEDYLKSGKPVIGLRTANHSFKYPADHPRFEWNDDFGRRALGTPYIVHQSSETAIKAIEEARRHPIMTNVKKSEWVSPGTLYLAMLEQGCQPLVMGSGTGKERLLKKRFGEIQVKKEESAVVAWAWENEWGGKVFGTSFGHPGDFAEESFTRMLVNSVCWATHRPIPGADAKISTWNIERADKKPKK